MKRLQSKLLNVGDELFRGFIIQHGSDNDGLTIFDSEAGVESFLIGQMFEWEDENGNTISVTPQQNGQTDVDNIAYFIQDEHRPVTYSYQLFLTRGEAESYARLQYEALTGQPYKGDIRYIETR